MSNLSFQSSPNLWLVSEFTEIRSINVHKRSSLTNAFDSSGINPKRINIRSTHYIHFTYHFTFEQILQKVIIHLLNSILFEEFILKFASPLRVVKNILDIVVLFFLFVN